MTSTPEDKINFKPSLIWYSRLPLPTSKKERQKVIAKILDEIREKEITKFEERTEKQNQWMRTLLKYSITANKIMNENQKTTTIPRTENNVSINDTLQNKKTNRSNLLENSR